MKRSKLSEEQVAYALRQAEAGPARREGCPRPRRNGGDLLHLEEALRALGCARGAARAAARGRKCALEAPGRRSDPRQAHVGGGPPAQKLTPTRRRELAGWFHGTFQIPIRRAGGLAQLSRTAWYRPGRAKGQTGRRLRIRELAHARPRFGYLRIWVLLRREGRLVNRKRVRRLYRLEGLQLRMRVRHRKHIALHRGPAPTPAGPKERWSMD